MYVNAGFLYVKLRNRGVKLERVKPGENQGEITNSKI